MCNNTMCFWWQLTSKTVFPQIKKIFSFNFMTYRIISMSDEFCMCKDYTRNIKYFHLWAYIIELLKYDLRIYCCIDNEKVNPQLKIHFWMKNRGSRLCYLIFILDSWKVWLKMSWVVILIAAHGNSLKNCQARQKWNL